MNDNILFLLWKLEKASSIQNMSAEAWSTTLKQVFFFDYGAQELFLIARMLNIWSHYFFVIAFLILKPV